jgi:hypothetical protein
MRIDVEMGRSNKWVELKAKNLRYIVQARGFQMDVWLLHPVIWHVLRPLLWLAERLGRVIVEQLTPNSTVFLKLETTEEVRRRSGQ